MDVWWVTRFYTFQNTKVWSDNSQSAGKCASIKGTVNERAMGLHIKRDRIALLFKNMKYCIEPWLIKNNVNILQGTKIPGPFIWKPTHQQLIKKSQLSFGPWYRNSNTFSINAAVGAEGMGEHIHFKLIMHNSFQNRHWVLQAKSVQIGFNKKNLKRDSCWLSYLSLFWISYWISMPNTQCCSGHSWLLKIGGLFKSDKSALKCIFTLSSYVN